LVVGISQYDDHNDLPTKNDPLKVRDFLLASGFDEVHVLTDEKVTLERLNMLMLDEFPSKVDKNDRFLLFWSGHGVERDNTYGGQTGFLPLANSKKGSFFSMASMDDISRWDGFLEAQHVLYLIDACFSGLAGQVSQSGHAELVVEQMLKPARYLLTAGTAEEETIASDQWGGSLFTYALLGGLSGAADTSTKEFPSDGVISLFELTSHIKKRVAVERSKKNWSKSITPQLRDLRGSDGEFFFLTSDRKTTEPIAETGASNLQLVEEDAIAAAEETERRQIAEEKSIAEQKREQATAAKKAEEERLAALALQIQQEETALAKKRRTEEAILRNRYHMNIKRRIEQKWRRPKGISGNVVCDVSVIQKPSGEIADVEVTSCSPNDKALRKSVENAIWDANPLPAAPRSSLFDRRLKFRFEQLG